MSDGTTMRFVINTCYESVFDDDIFSVLVSTPEGDAGLLPHHENFLCVVKPGEIKVKTKSDTLCFTTDGGILHMCDNKTVLLTGFAALSSEYTEKRGERQSFREKRDSEEMKSEAELQRIQMALQQNLIQS